MSIAAIDLLLLKNGEIIEQVDKYVNYLTMVVPGQTSQVELVCECFAAVMALIQVRKDQIIAKYMSYKNKSLESLFLDAQFRLHKSYRTLAYILSVIKSTELLTEMSAAYFKGNRGRWRAVVTIESVKAVIRLAMLIISRKIIPSALPLHKSELDQNEIMKLVDTHQAPTDSSQSGTKPAISIHLTPRQQLRVMSTDYIRPPLQLLRDVRPQLAVSELIAILRPVIYAALLQKYRHRPKSWRPWLIGVFLEVCSGQLASAAMQKPVPMSGLEKEIYGSRQRDMIWWLMRGAAYEHYTKRIVLGISEKLSYVPLLNVLGRVLEDSAEYFNDYYFTTVTV